MSEFATVARPYAKALFELAEKNKQVETWLSGLVELAWLMQQAKVTDLLEQADWSATQKADELIRDQLALPKYVQCILLRRLP